MEIKKRYMNKFYVFLVLICGMQIAYGQIGFRNANERLATDGVHSGVAIGVLDVNNDGLDDIIRLADAKFLLVEYQTMGANPFETKLIGSVSNNNQWSMCAADVDNNGLNDIITGGAYDGVHLAKANEEGTSYTLEDLPGPGLFLQGSNLVDINNDGFVDYFGCHDDAESRIWQNDGNGHFIPADDWIDMQTTPVSDNSGNYGSIWTDFDNDGDIDLYIAKCRLNVDDPTDPRRINALYLNDGNGHFTERADSFNLKIGAQSWTADFQDIDNDGDYDCFITNHDLPSMLLENDGTGVFIDITEQSGVIIGGVAIQGVMRDFDNDGFVDIIVAGTQQYLYKNNGDKTFTRIEGLFDQNDMESYAIGDLNHDGYLDIYAGYANLYTNPSNIDDILWLNTGGENNFFSVRLEGTISNRNGIGARVEIYGNWGVQVREVRAGESYGIMNSMQQHFGLGENETVDSLIVRWPSGHVDVHENLAANQFVEVIENTCVSPYAELVLEGEAVFCTGSSVDLSVTEGYTYAWSTGESTTTIAATTAGSYNVTISDGTACESVSPIIELDVDPIEIPIVEIVGETEFCEGGIIILTSSESNSYTWNTGETTQEIEVSESGEYFVTIQGLCDEFDSEPVGITVLDATEPIFDGIEVVGGDVTIYLTGDSIHWYADEQSDEIIAYGNQLSTTVENDTTLSYFAENISIYAGPVISAGKENHAGSNYSGNQFNGGIEFDCFMPFTLQNVKVTTDTEGPRIIELQDSEGNVLQSLEVFIPTGEHIITLDFSVEPAEDLLLTTNEASNLEHFNFESARLQRSSQNVNYPYVVEDILSMNSSNFGGSRYYYFYDWQIQLDGKECLSERVEIPILIDNLEEIEFVNKVDISPNPTIGQVRIHWPSIDTKWSIIQVLDYTGQLLHEDRVQDNSTIIDMTNWPAGMYWIKVQEGKRLYSNKVIKQ